MLAAWDSFLGDGGVSRAIWQSTTGTAPFTVVNGPVRTAIGLNSRGNLCGSGFRANATIGRAIRLGSLNAFGLRPHVLDQATQGTPGQVLVLHRGERGGLARGRRCTWTTGWRPTDSACTSTVIRSVLHIEARHTIVPEQLATDLADSICRTGAMVRAFASVYVVLNPEHARLLDKHGWSKQDLRQAIIERGSRTYRELAASGKEAIAKGTGWRLPADHPDALPADGAVRPGHAGADHPVGPSTCRSSWPARPTRGCRRSSRRSARSAARRRSPRSKSKVKRVPVARRTSQVRVAVGRSQVLRTDRGSTGWWIAVYIRVYTTIHDQPAPG